MTYAAISNPVALPRLMACASTSAVSASNEVPTRSASQAMVQGERCTRRGTFASHRSASRWLGTLLTGGRQTGGPKAEDKGPYGIRTRAAAVRGRCPRPLDEWAVAAGF